MNFKNLSPIPGRGKRVGRGVEECGRGGLGAGEWETGCGRGEEEGAGVDKKQKFIYLCVLHGTENFFCTKVFQFELILAATNYISTGSLKRDMDRKT